MYIMYNVINRKCLLDLEHYFFPFKINHNCMLETLETYYLLFASLRKKLFCLKYVAGKYKEKHYHDPLNQGDGVEQPLSICFSKSCDKLFMVNNRSYMYGVPVDSFS